MEMDPNHGLWRTGGKSMPLKRLFNMSASWSFDRSKHENPSRDLEGLSKL